MTLLFLVLAAVDDPQPISAQHDAWVDDAAHALDEGNADAAVPLLTRYLGDVAQRYQTANFTLLGRAWLLLATAHARRGKEDEMKASLEELARLRPDVSLEGGDYPPLFVRLHQKALQRSQDKATAALRIGAPADATLSLNGRPLSGGFVTKVPPGVHYVAMQIGAKQIARKLDVKAGEVKVVTFAGAAAPDGEAQSYFALNAVGAPAQVIIEKSSPTPEPERRPRAITLPSTADATAPPPAQKVLVVSPAEAEHQNTVAKTAEPLPIYKQWWLWTIVGVAIAGATTAAVLVATAKVGDVSVTAEWK